MRHNQPKVMHHMKRRGNVIADFVKQFQDWRWRCYMANISNQVMHHVRRKHIADVTYSFMTVFAWLVVMSIAGALMVAYAADSFIPVP